MRQKSDREMAILPVKDVELLVVARLGFDDRRRMEQVNQRYHYMFRGERMMMLGPYLESGNLEACEWVLKKYPTILQGAFRSRKYELPCDQLEAAVRSGQVEIFNWLVQKRGVFPLRDTGSAAALCALEIALNQGNLPMADAVLIWIKANRHYFLPTLYLPPIGVLRHLRNLSLPVLNWLYQVSLQDGTPIDWAEFASTHPGVPLPLFH